MIFRDKIKYAYREVFESPSGELVMQDLIKFCRVFKAHPVGKDAERCEGMRNVALYILDKLSQKQYKEMIDNQTQYDEQVTYDRIFADPTNAGI